MARVWRCGRFSLTLDRPYVMGIVNVTPDSFSDGGRFSTHAEAVEAAFTMLHDGADILDVGGESTRPGSAEVPSAEEMARVLPVIEALVADGSAPVSVDTRHADVAAAALAAGAHILNDVAGFRDDAMRELAAGSDCGCVVMHMLGEPRGMQDAPRYGDVTAEVRDWLLARAEELEAAGVAPDRICLDPGIGFGKTLEHNLLLLRDLPGLAAAGYPVLVGVSRKRMIGELAGVREPVSRLGGSVGAAAWAVTHGADVVRVHDVAETAQALWVVGALEGRG